MTHRESSYYPRRATIFSPLLGLFATTRRMVSRLAFRLAAGITYHGLLLSFIVPGLGFYFRSPDRSGKAVLALCGLLGLTFFAFLGQAAGTAAFTILITIHVVGLVAYCNPILALTSHRFLGSLGLACGVIFLVYLPLENGVSNHLFTPLVWHKRVVVVCHFRAMNSIHRGDWIAFEVAGERQYFREGGAHGNVIIRPGMNLAPVLAVPGDHVEFGPKYFTINGAQRPRLDFMPTSGGLTVPPHCWFAWPEFGAEGHGNVPPADITRPLMEIAQVTPDRFVGRVFQHWFGRRQTLA